MALSDAIAEKADSHGDASEYLYNKCTLNGDIIVLTFDGNCSLFSRVLHCQGEERTGVTLDQRESEEEEDKTPTVKRTKETSWSKLSYVPCDQFDKGNCQLGDQFVINSQL